jgi:CHASE3 domain sensor protein
MTLLANLRVRTKLSIGFGSIAFLLVLVGATAYWGMGQLSAATNHIDTVVTP